jgi:acyl-CoA reductase-like NAD-dependent aldehyde dehydrogenase
VLADADLDYAVEATAFAAFFHSGQICMNARKVLVEASIYDTFIDRLTVRAQQLPAGDPGRGRHGHRAADHPGRA